MLNRIVSIWLAVWSRNCLRLLGLVMIFSLATVMGARAQVVSFNITGTVASVFDSGTYLPDDIQSGQAISGTITYSGANVTDLASGDPETGYYFFTGAAQNDFSMTVSVTVPGHVYSFTSVTTPPINQNRIDVLKPTFSGLNHSIEYDSGDPLMDGAPLPATANGSALGFTVSDPTRTALSSDALPTSAPSYAAFSSHSLNLDGYTTGGSLVYSVSATVDSITPLPEPATAGASVGFGLMAFVGLRRAIRNRGG